jgi:hypothetical protein
MAAQGDRRRDAGGWDLPADMIEPQPTNVKLTLE